MIQSIQTKHIDVCVEGVGITNIFAVLAKSSKPYTESESDREYHYQVFIIAVGKNADNKNTYEILNKRVKIASIKKLPYITIDSESCEAEKQPTE